MRSIIRYGLAWCLAFAFFAGVVQADDNKEYLVKAAFIYNFVKFVEWPDGKSIAKQNSINVCVIGDSPLSDTGSVFKAASTSKLALQLVDEKNPHNVASHCHIAFIGESESGHLGEILGALKSQPVLTVSDIDDFADKGGMIGFITDENKVKLVINPKAATATGMRIDAQLLEIATKVVDK